jgi:hypothetical protein
LPMSTGRRRGPVFVVTIPGYDTVGFSVVVS